MFRVQVQKQESKSEGDVTSFFLEMNKDTTALEKSRDAAKDEINGGNRLAALLCKHYSVSVTPEAYGINPCESFNAPLSATKAPKKDGKGYESIRNISIPSSMKWLKNISSCKPLTDFNF